MQDSKYAMGIDVGNGEDYSVALAKRADGTIDFRAEYGAKFKTGRRESQRGLPLHLGQRVGKAAVCGHKIVPSSQPRKVNCFDCWHYYFSLNAKLVFTSFEFLRNGREAELRDVHGTKWVKQFKAFVMHVQSLAPIEPSDAVSAEVS